jgi:hypothetical protein
MIGCILFTDVKASSKLWAAHPKEMLKLLLQHEKIIRGAIAKRKGLLVKTIGDAVMAKFATLLDGVMCAIEIQTALKARPIKFSRSADVLQIRIGIAHGQIQSRDTIIQGFKVKDFFGATVNIASRMESKVSKVGGFAVYMNNIPKKILDIIREKCRVERVEFRNNCSMSLAEPIARSRRLLMSTICQDAAALHIDDGREHTALSCEIL